MSFSSGGGKKKKKEPRTLRRQLTVAHSVWPFLRPRGLRNRTWYSETEGTSTGNLFVQLWQWGFRCNASNCCASDCTTRRSPLPRTTPIELCTGIRTLFETQIYRFNHWKCRVTPACMMMTTRFLTPTNRSPLNVITFSSGKKKEKRNAIVSYSLMIYLHFNKVSVGQTDVPYTVQGGRLGELL